jgi:hypothetical protein
LLASDLQTSLPSNRYLRLTQFSTSCCQQAA